jgi:hypothetical protein
MTAIIVLQAQVSRPYSEAYFSVAGLCGDSRFPFPPRRDRKLFLAGKAQIARSAEAIVKQHSELPSLLKSTNWTKVD